MSERDKILGRIHEALTVPAANGRANMAGHVPRPAQTCKAGPPQPAASANGCRPVGETFEDRIALFSRETPRN